MDALNQGAVHEMQSPDISSDFPVWQFVGVGDDRERESHAHWNGRYFLNATPFAAVRDAIKGEYDGFNCRCSPKAIFRSKWRRLQEAGAELSTI